MAGEKKMRIALITPYYFPILGGYTLIAHGLSRSFREKGHEVKVLTPTCAPSYKDENVLTFEKRPLPFKEKRGILKGLNFFEKMFGYKELTSVQSDMVLKIEKINPDIVHTFGAIQYGFVGTISSARNFKWIHTFITQPPNRISFFKRTMVRKVFSRADSMTVTATNQLRDIKEKYGLEASIAIPVGVDTNFFTPSPQSMKTPIIGAVSNFVWKEKVEGLLLLIRSFKRVRSTYPDIKLKIVGEGDYRKLVEETIKENGLEKEVELLGKMTREEICKFYQSISVFVHISYQDTLPLTVLEAMASGLAVVGSNIGDVPRVMSEKAGLVIEMEEVAIANAILRLLDSQELRENLGRSARKKVEQEYSWPKVVDEYLEAYGSLL
ncbi:MAG: glycosyltransferase family 4 protein [Thermoplasmata archaeon]|nr:MAG: glycosyltransferase family 4 protein [Thermoplasmata archaeon]